MVNYWKLDDGYLLNLNLDKEGHTSSIPLEKLIFIVDISGSMGSQASRVINDIIPGILEEYGVSESEKFHLITFTSGSVSYDLTIEDFRNFRVPDQMGTYMEAAIDMLGAYIYENKDCNFKILTLSDGDISDQKETIQKSNELSEKLNSEISSVVIRFFTYGEPEFDALASLLKLNTGNQNLYPIHINQKENTAEIVEQLIKVWLGDAQRVYSPLEADSSCLSKSPWLGYKKEIKVQAGDNLVWMDKLPKELLLGGKEIKLRPNENYNDFLLILTKLMSGNLSRLRLLSTMNSDSADIEAKAIVNFFASLRPTVEKIIKEDEGNSRLDNHSSFKMNPSLSSRVEQVKKKIERRTLQLFDDMVTEVSQNEKIKKFNSAQKAEYLRNANMTKLSKDLVKRADKYAPDLDEMARDSLLCLYNNRKHLDAIDSTNHKTSLCSLSTTIDGLKELFNFIDMGVLKSINSNDIIELINFVGISVRGKIAEYPDPSMYRIQEVYSNTYASCSDLIANYKSNDGLEFTYLNTKKCITDAIPLFDDAKLLEFFHKYGKDLLDINASFGMRRSLAKIPMTYEFSLASCILAMINKFKHSILEADVEVFVQLLKNFINSTHGYFKKLMKTIYGNQPEKLTFNNMNLGIIHMIYPIHFMVVINEYEILYRLLRSTYSREYSLLIKRKLKNDGLNNKEELNKLLNLKNKPQCTDDELFTEVKYEMPSKVDYNKELLDEYLQETRKIDNLLILTAFIDVASKPHEKDIFMKMEPLNFEKLSALLQVDSFHKFKVRLIIQSLMYPNQSARYNSEQNVMLIPDPEYRSSGDKMTRNYSYDFWKKDQASFFKNKETRERDIVIKRIVNMMLHSESIEKFKSIIKEGLECSGKVYRIEDEMKKDKDWTVIKGKFFGDSIEIDDEKDIELFLNKIWILLTGRDIKDTNEVVWNRGNCVRNMTGFAKLYLVKFGEKGNEMLEKIIKHNEEHNIWKYRSKGNNRHKHGKGILSYWALGFKTVEEMKQAYLENGEQDKWEAYIEEHGKNNCCGLTPRSERIKELIKIKKKWHKNKKKKINETKK